MKELPFLFDGWLMIGIALALLWLAHRDYQDAPPLVRLPIYGVIFFAVCCGAHELGLRWHAFARPYWARIGFDVAVAAALALRITVGRFMPAWRGAKAPAK